jgi:hypothetical protein
MPDKHSVDHFDERNLDQLLDHALARYADAEPDPSLRARIMEATADVRPRPWRIGWLAAASCTAALLLAFLLYPANRAPKNRAVQGRAAATPPSQPPTASAKVDHSLTGSAHPHVVAAIRHGYNRRKPTSPRRSISLASAPLTEEETILLRFAQQHPEQAREVLSPPPSGPLQTDPVIIAPIQIADLSGSRPDSH